MALTLDDLIVTVKDIGREIEEAEEDKRLLSKKISELKINLKNMDEAINILVAVLSITQEGVTKFIQDVVGMALQYVYGDEYDFYMEFEMKRNQPEIILTPIKEGKAYDPKYGCGVGVLDVCAFALRLALWALNEPRTAPVLIFDEPFKHISGNVQMERCAEMVKELSDMLGLQIIIVSGKNSLTERADGIFEVNQIDGISGVTERRNEKWMK